MTQKNYLIILSTVLLVILTSYWFINRQKPLISEEVGAPLPAAKPLTAEEIAKISESLTVLEEKELSPTEKQRIEASVTAPSRESNSSQDEMEKLLQSLSASQ